MLDCLATLAHRFFIGGFRTPAAEYAALLSSGRHPKPFALADIP
jgi:hypothetical protein